MNNSEAIIPVLKSSDDFFHAEKLINALLLNHPKIKHGWYAIASGKDTVYVTLDKNDTGYKRGTISGYQKKWIDSQLITKDSVTRIGTIINVNDSLHGLLASRHRLADSSMLILGLDINFKDLQRYLWGVDSNSRASTYIIDEKGHYITNPDEKLIGKRVSGEVKRAADQKLADSISTYEMVNYLT